jgi:hypothetical protein
MNRAESGQWNWMENRAHRNQISVFIQEKEGVRATPILIFHTKKTPKPKGFGAF